MSLNALFFPKVEPVMSDLYIPEILNDIWVSKSYISAVNNKRDMIIVDAGANIGMTAQYLRQFAKKVYSLEPSPDNFEALKMNKEFNNWDNVEIFNVALFDRVGEATFNLCRNHTANSLYKYGNGVNQYYDEPIKVKTTDVLTFFKENNITTVDFFKMDIEGSEDAVLLSKEFSSVVPDIKTLLVEFHLRQNNLEELVSLVHSWGFHSQRSPHHPASFMFHK